MVTDPPYGVDYDPNWRNKAGVSATKRTARSQTTTAPTGAKPGRCSPATRPMSGTRRSMPPRWPKASSPPASICVRRSSGRRIASRSGEATIIGSTNPAGTRCAKKRRAIGKARGIAPIGTEDAATAHGTQKPVEAMRRPIVNNSERGDLIYEPFAGSGTTLIAAETVGRTCLAMEVDPAYCDVVVERWEADVAGCIYGIPVTCCPAACHRSAAANRAWHHRVRRRGDGMAMGRTVPGHLAIDCDRPIVVPENLARPLRQDRRRLGAADAVTNRIDLWRARDARGLRARHARRVPKLHRAAVHALHGRGRYPSDRHDAWHAMDKHRDAGARGLRASSEPPARP